MTLLKRIGNKDKISEKVISHFPAHTLYIELFFGAGGIFFNKVKSKYSILNDLDDEVFNFYIVVKDNPEEFRKALERLVVSESLFKYWGKNRETDDIMKAIRFLYLSNFGLYGQSETFSIKPSGGNAKKLAIERIDRTIEMLNDIMIINQDFRKALKSISFRHQRERDSAFIYADPPYLETSNNYNTCKWKEQDTIDLFEVLVNSNIRFAMSEFDNPKVLDLANKHNLKVIEIGERQNLKNRRIEILITN